MLEEKKKKKNPPPKKKQKKNKKKKTTHKKTQKKKKKKQKKKKATKFWTVRGRGKERAGRSTPLVKKEERGTATVRRGRTLS